MSNYTQENSHDPKTDHRSLVGLAVAIVIALIAIPVAFLAPKGKVEPEPQPYTSIDGCTVYRFNDEDGKNYFARCPNGKVSTTDTNDQSIITE